MTQPKTGFNSKILIPVAIAAAMGLTSSCTSDVVIKDPKKKDVEPRHTSILVASDRHDTANGNNLMSVIQIAVNRMDVTPPSLVVLGGDYVGGIPTEEDPAQPPFSITQVRDEVRLALAPRTSELVLTYGSQDRNCTEGYNVFFSGPRLGDYYYYLWGITYAQMAFATDSIAQAAHYDGLDIEDRWGYSAEKATAAFKLWVNSLNDKAPIIVMSHMPIHATSLGDNTGGLRWLEAINEVADNHDILFLYGHNYMLEERGDYSDQYAFLISPGETINAQGDSSQGVQRRKLSFTYANAGYLTQGWSTLITFTDLDKMEIRRFNIFGQDDTTIGLTNKPNPYTAALQGKKQ